MAQVGNAKCAECDAGVAVYRGSKLGSLYYNCGGCGFRVNYPAGTPSHVEALRALGLRE